MMRDIFSREKRCVELIHLKIINIMKQFYRNILLSIEKEVSRNKKSIIDEAYHMVSYLDR